MQQKRRDYHNVLERSEESSEMDAKPTNFQPRAQAEPPMQGLSIGSSSRRREEENKEEEIGDYDVAKCSEESSVPDVKRTSMLPVIQHFSGTVPSVPDCEGESRAAPVPDWAYSAATSMVQDVCSDLFFWLQGGTGNADAAMNLNDATSAVVNVPNTGRAPLVSASAESDADVLLIPPMSSMPLASPQENVVSEVEHPVPPAGSQVSQIPTAKMDVVDTSDSLLLSCEAGVQCNSDPTKMPAPAITSPLPAAARFACFVKDQGVQAGSGGEAQLEEEEEEERSALRATVQKACGVADKVVPQWPPSEVFDMPAVAASFGKEHHRDELPPRSLGASSGPRRRRPLSCSMTQAVATYRDSIRQSAWQQPLTVEQLITGAPAPALAWTGRSGGARSPAVQAAGRAPEPPGLPEQVAGRAPIAVSRQRSAKSWQLPPMQGCWEDLGWSWEPNPDDDRVPPFSPREAPGAAHQVRAPMVLSTRMSRLHDPRTAQRMQIREATSPAGVATWSSPLSLKNGRHLRDGRNSQPSRCLPSSVGRSNSRP